MGVGLRAHRAWGLGFAVEFRVWLKQKYRIIPWSYNLQVAKKLCREDGGQSAAPTASRAELATLNHDPEIHFFEFRDVGV